MCVAVFLRTRALLRGANPAGLSRQCRGVDWAPPRHCQSPTVPELPARVANAFRHFSKAHAFHPHSSIGERSSRSFVHAKNWRDYHPHDVPPQLSFVLHLWYHVHGHVASLRYLLLIPPTLSPVISISFPPNSSEPVQKWKTEKA